MFKQTDGVAMGSPLGPVFANFFLGYCETLIPDEFWPELYTRYVDDTFSFFTQQDHALTFLERLNSIHPSLQFTMEKETENQLPFLDVLVTRHSNSFSTAIYRKPTFTGLYTRWDSYGPTGQKIALIKSLTVRAQRICSPQHLDNEISKSWSPSSPAMAIPCI
eukprot:scpid103206/ scgid33888/ 